MYHTNARLISAYDLVSEFKGHFPSYTFIIQFPEDVLQHEQDYFFKVYPDEMEASYTTAEEFLETLTKVNAGVYEIYHDDMLLWLIRCGYFDPYDGQWCIVE